MKHLICSFLLILQFMIPAGMSAQRVATPITQPSQLQVEQNYIIAYADGKTIVNSFLSNSSDGNYLFGSNYKATVIDEKFIEKSAHFTLKHDDAGYHLYASALGGYLKYTGQSNRCTMTITDEQGASVITFDADMALFIDGRPLLGRKGSSMYSVKSSVGSDNLPVHLYRIETVIQLPSTGKWPVLNTDGVVEYDRQFVPGKYNTLMLPFTIHDYQQVFGANVRAFQLKEVTGDSLIFEPVPDDGTLEANTPYLLQGYFRDGPYLVKGVHVDTTTPARYDIGVLTFSGSYDPATDVGGTSALVLYDNAFYTSRQSSKVLVSPGRWYVMMTGGDAAKGWKKLRIIRH